MIKIKGLEFSNDVYLSLNFIDATLLCFENVVLQNKKQEFDTAIK